MFQNPDIAKLLLRLTLGVMMLTHGIHKIIHGVGGIEKMLVAHSLPAILAFGVYVGEVIAPIFIILGVYARVASGILAINMLVAIYLAYGFSLTLNKHGALQWELAFIYMVMGVLVILLGSGKYSVNRK